MTAPPSPGASGEPSGRTGVDLVGFSNLTEGQGVGQGAAGAVTGTATPPRPSTAPATARGDDDRDDRPHAFSVEAWVKTTSSRGGKIVGFGTRRR